MPSHPADATELLFARLVRTTKLRNLQIAAFTAELGSLQKAAQALRISQPAATKAIADLESQLGMPLFERHARGMRMTRAGHEILPFIRRVIDDTRHCAERAIHHRLGAASTLRVASVAAGISGVLAGALGAFCRRHPNVVVDVHEADIFAMSSLIAEDGAELFICRRPGDIPQGYAFEPLVDDTHVLVAPVGHPLAGGAEVGIGQLAGFEWLLPPSGVPAREIFENLWADAGIDPPPLCRATTRSPLLTAELVNKLGLIAVVPFTIARPSLEAQTLTALGFKHLRGLGPMGAMWRAADPSAPLQQMLDTLRHTAARIAARSS
jgi:DNA-binding transcriptional LysR family regulator